MKHTEKENLPQKPSTMLERLGNVIYWASCIFATIFFLYLYTAAEAAQYDIATRLVTAILAAIAIWLCGLASRYVLANRGW